ncbi:hypothetical protein PVL29_011175 [Vitis rotundifolia]|uniref:DUF4220 domain-containing protein n=1 Tax=Vitis rotundifolia TaxID=103349 RepID=A0AA38ZNB7_VITRO|nr:hypothetical protein PVL29_011175 [Vitis rotundifolia]
MFSSFFLQRRGARATQILPESVRKLWNEWELRLIVPLSLFLEIVLIIFSNRRKYTATPWIRILIWSAYLCADWVATLSLGTLANSQGDSKGKLLDPNYTLMACWAPFLLLHLGGPDTLGLVVQAGVAFYVFLRSWAGTPLTFLSIPMFVAGIIKYGERTWVLRFATKNHFRDSLLPGPVNRITKVEIEIPGGEYLHIAYFLFKQQLSHLYADLILSPDDQKTSEGIIRCMSFEEAFKVVEMELSFLYDALYTKATVAYSLVGIILRTASFLSTISTFAAFCFFIDRHEFSNIDINITYALLFGAIFLEIYAIIMLILSDWSIVWLSSKNDSLADSICRAIASFQSVVTSDQRWSRRMAQNNLIDSCLRDKTKFNPVPRFFDMNKFLERYWYMTWEKVDDMKKPIFCRLLEVTNDARDRRQLLKHTGDYVTRKKGFFETLRWRIIDVEFDHSILLWHIATDLCYPCDVDKSLDTNLKSRCKISKCLSEYMLYLFFQERSNSISNRNEACKLLLEVDTEVEPREAKEDKSKSVLFEAYAAGEKWEMISGVWVEMLCCAASHCGWIQHRQLLHHRQQLRRGGELLTYVCLLMSHLGLTEQFQVLEGEIVT